MSINNAEFAKTIFKNSNLNNLEIKNSILNDITFDEGTIISEELKYQIYIDTSLQPIENYLNYFNRVIKNQLIERFGFTDENPLSNFY